MDEAIRRTRRGITVKLEMTQKQELKLTPQMLQSMEILQMSTQELEAYLQELVQENPAAELSEPEERPDEGEELWRRMQSLADQDNQNRQYVAAEREELDPLARIGTDGGLEDTLLLHLSRQLERSQAPTLVLRGAQFLAACLDEAGYLREKVENLAQAAGLPAAVLEEGLSLLQTLDPAGVGARDLSQCLELQLRRRGEEGTALAIVQRGLERLARRQYRALAQELGVSRQEVLRAEAQIRALAEAGYTGISFDELQAYVLRGEPLPEKPVVITFDDGYRSNYTLAYPILQKYGMKATIFAIGVSFGTDHYKDTDYAITPHFGADEAAEMTASGLISIQSHTYDMHQWPPYETGSAVRENILQLPGESEESYVQALTEDFTRSRALLEGATGQPVDVLAYPAGQYSTLAQVTLQSLGVHVTLSTNPGVNTVVKGLPQTLYAMLRFGITEDISPEALLDMIQ